MPGCGSQVILCNLPIRFDTYKGCSHLCKYCFVQRKGGLNKISVGETVTSLKGFIEGKRNLETNWCDWDIPLHWGGLSDPFQPVEQKCRNSYECLELLAETKYPFVVSTKGKLIIEKEYLKLLEKCNCVVQISAVCSKYDKLEQGAPSFEERLKMISILSGVAKRVNVRIQPYMTEVFEDVMENIPRFKEAGVYGIIVEGMKFAKKKPGLIKIGGDYGYEKSVLESDFRRIRERVHQYGMKFYSGENRLRSMGDSDTCCGIDGLEGFKPNAYNLCNILNGVKAYPTECMKKTGTARCFMALNQTSAENRNIVNKTFSGYMINYYMDRQNYIKELFGK